MIILILHQGELVVPIKQGHRQGMVNRVRVNKNSFENQVSVISKMQGLSGSDFVQKVEIFMEFRFALQVLTMLFCDH